MLLAYLYSNSEFACFVNSISTVLVPQHCILYFTWQVSEKRSKSAFVSHYNSELMRSYNSIILIDRWSVTWYRSLTSGLFDPHRISDTMVVVTTLQGIHCSCSCLWTCWEYWTRSLRVYQTWILRLKSVLHRTGEHLLLLVKLEVTSPEIGRRL